MAANEPTFGERMNMLEQQYAARFGGRSRLTRDLVALDALILQSEELVEWAESLGAEEKTAASEARSFYLGERAEIVAAREKAGPDGLEASLLGHRANSQIHRYRRHFAGQSRESRDLRLLLEILGDFKAIQSRMATLQTRAGIESLAHDREVVDGYVELLEKEQGAIVKSREGASLTDRAMGLAAIANGQFAIYRTHFAGKSRASRRPALLERVIQTLGEVEEAMVQLENSGFQAEFNTKNLGIVRNNKEAYEREINAVKEARAALSPDDLAGHLGAAANAIAEEYRSDFAGQDRKTRSLEQMGSLCDQLGEVERQMLTLDADHSLETNLRNMGLVRDTMRVYEAEFDAIIQAKSEQK